MANWEQRESLDGVEPGRIPSAVDFPLETILKYYPEKHGHDALGNPMNFGRGWIWDMGFGNGLKADQLRNNRFTVGGYDINELAVSTARSRGDFFGKPGDIRHFGEGDEAMWDTITWLEGVDALLFQAVFPSLLGTSWKDALEAADMMLRPGQYMFVGDFLEADKTYSELLQQGDSDVWIESAKRWAGRYKVNQRAFADLGLPYGTVAVGALGPRKFEYDWSDDASLLRYLFDIRKEFPEGFERFARHLPEQEFERLLVNELGYTIVEKEYVPRRSRSNTPENQWTVAPGVNWVFQKSPTYKYHPWRQGVRADDPRAFNISLQRKGSPHRADYFDEYYGLLLPKVPSSQRPVFEAMARSVGVQV